MSGSKGTREWRTASVARWFKIQSRNVTIAAFGCAHAFHDFLLAHQIIDEVTGTMSIDVVQSCIESYVREYIRATKTGTRPAGREGMVHSLSEQITNEVSRPRTPSARKGRKPNRTFVYAYSQVVQPLILSVVHDVVREIAAELTFEMDLNSCEGR